MNLYWAKAKQGELVWDNKKAVRDYLSTIENKSVYVQIDREHGVRSSNQNNWLWGVIYKVIADSTGHTENDIHELMKKMFLPPISKTILGKNFLTVKSTTKLNKIEFGDYVERIRAFVADFGIEIPNPQ